jgi:hypothetical protein
MDFLTRFGRRGVSLLAREFDVRRQLPIGDMAD